MTSCQCRKWHPGTGCSEGRDADEQGNPIDLVDCRHYQPLTCAHCGHTGPDVEMAYPHIGGYGNPQPSPHCINRIACWQRWGEINWPK